MVIGTFLLCVSCKAKEGAMGKNAEKVVPVIIDKSLTKVFDMAHKIDTAFINGDVLTLKISFNNSCKTDTFELVGNGKFAKSNPPLSAVFFRRKASQGNCKETLQKMLKFDVSLLRYPLMNKVVLNLDEQYKITYSY